MMKRILIPLCFLVTSLVQGVGFLGCTKVKTPTGYTRIDEIKKGDTVIAYDFKEKCCVDRKVMETHKQDEESFFMIWASGQEITVTRNHKFYEAEDAKWIPVQDLRLRHVLSQNCNTSSILVDRIFEIQADGIAYDICVEEHHNFFVTESDILVQNVIPIFVWGAGTVAFVGWEAVGAGLLSTVAGIGATWFVNGVMKNVFGATGGVDYSYNECVMDEFLNDIRFQHQEMTRKEARKVAGEKGWIEINDPPINSHGQPVFKDGRKFITPDVDGHRGGRWKVFEDGDPNKRKTYKDDDLTKEVGD